MSKSWKRGSKHFVRKTRKDHKCEDCKEIIIKGSSAFYRNLFTGKRGYEHAGNCPPETRRRLAESEQIGKDGK